MKVDIKEKELAHQEAMKNLKMVNARNFGMGRIHLIISGT